MTLPTSKRLAALGRKPDQKVVAGAPSSDRLAKEGASALVPSPSQGEG